MTPARLEWLDGPKLVTHLRERGFSLSDNVLGYHARAVRHWRDGGMPSVYEADKVLTKLDVHLDELPDDLWLSSSPKHRSYPAAVREEVARRVAGGESMHSVARQIGCSRKSVSNWVRAERVAA